jgi:hypothetical protein
MTPQEWKDLLDYLKANDVLLTYYPETDNDGLFVDLKYAIVEYDGEFYSLQGNSNKFEPFTVTRYLKVSPYAKRQSAYPYEIYDTEQLLAYMRQCGLRHKVGGCEQRIYLTSGLYRLRDGYTDLWRLKNEIARYREKAVLENLAHITMQRNTKDYCVLRFHSSNGDWFDYETKSKRITQ